MWAKKIIYSRGGQLVQARRLKKSFLFGHLFFNITNVFSPKNGWGMLVYAPMVTA